MILALAEVYMLCTGCASHLILCRPCVTAYRQSRSDKIARILDGFAFRIILSAHKLLVLSSSQIVAEPSFARRTCRGYFGAIAPDSSAAG